MANIEEAIRRLKYLYEVHGAEQVTAAQAAITASTTATERASLSLEKSFNNLERKYVSTVRAQQDYARVQEKVNDAVRQNPALQERGNVILANAAQQYQNASRGLTVYGKALDQSTQQGRLARHELINLSRQFQDVGVGIVSGQSPFTILVQQGAQIADVFATSTGTLRGFFQQAGAGAARFATSAAGIATGVTALGGAIVYTSASFSSGQRDIERALMGIGQGAGVTRDQINQIGQTSSSAFGLSRSEAEQAASAFAATGKIYGQNVEQATRLINDFVRAGGDATEATKTLAQALADPAKGALELDKQYGFLTASTLDYIRTLQSQGKLQEAHAVLMEEVTPKIQEQAKTVGWLRKEWNAAGNDLSNFMRWVGRAASRDFERITGIASGGFSMDEQLAEARERLARAQPIPGQAIPLVSRRQLQQAEEDVRRLEKALADLAAAPAAERLRVLGLEVDAITRAIMPSIAQIEKLTAALSKMRLHREQTDGPMTGAEKVGTVRLVELQQQEAATIRVAQATAEIALQYPGMSTGVAKILALQKDQLSVTQAIGGQAKMAAQEEATYNALRMEGKTIEEASAVAASQRANQQAQLNAAVQEQNVALQNQLRVSSAVGGLAQINAQHAATIANLTSQGVAPAVATANADAQRANALADTETQALKLLVSLREQFNIVSAVTQAEQMAAQKKITTNQLIREGVSETTALAIAQQQYVNAVASANAAVGRQILGIEDQIRLLNTRTKEEESFVRALIAEEQALRSGASAGVADDLRRASLALDRAKTAKETADANKRAADEMERESAAMERLAASAGKFANAFQIAAGERPKGPSKGAFYQDELYILSQVKAGLMRFDEAIGAMINPLERNTMAYVPTKKAMEESAERIVSETGSVTAALNRLIGEGGYGGLGTSQRAKEETEVRTATINRLLELLPEKDQIAQIEKLLAQTKQSPVTLAREEMIKELTDKLADLKDSTDGLNDSMKEMLSPYYATDPRLSKIGFRSDSGAYNPDRILTEAELGKRPIALPKPLTQPTPAPVGIGPNPGWGRAIDPSTLPYLDPRTQHYGMLRGMASGGSMTVPGGYSRNDNYLLPVRSGERINVNTPERGVVITAPINININGPTDKNTARETGFQVQRAMRRAVLGRG